MNPPLWFLIALALLPAAALVLLPNPPPAAVQAFAFGLAMSVLALLGRFLRL